MLMVVGRRKISLGWLMLLALVLFAGVFLRWASLDKLASMSHTDEAWNGIDALGLLRQPRLTPFMPTNNGREAGWMYAVALMVGIFGANPFALHLTSAFASVVTLAVMSRLGRELFGRPGALWTMGALAIFYWPIHISQQALRINSFIFMGALTALMLLIAERRMRWKWWAAAGLVLGLMVYTYFAASLLIAYCGLLLAAVAIFSKERARRLGALAALLCAAVVLAPMGLYLLTHTAQFLERPASVFSVTPASVADSLQKWAGAWFYQGDSNLEFNFPGRPILDPYTGILFVLGVPGLFILARRRRFGLILLGWAMVTWFPSLVSDLPPHFSRAVGLTVPITVVLGAGGQWLSALLQRALRRTWAQWLPLALLVPAGYSVYVDLHIKWVNDLVTYKALEVHINSGFNYLRLHALPGDSVYASPFPSDHPVVVFRQAELAPRHVAGFVSAQCLPVSDHRADYIVVTMYEPQFADNLGQWAQVTILDKDTAPGYQNPRYTVFAAEPLEDQLHPAGLPVVRFDNWLEVRLLKPLPTTVRPGDTLLVVLGIQPLQTPGFYPSLFVHLYGIPTPYQGGKLWAQADSEVCASYAAPLWDTAETIIQTFPLAIPADLPPGTYTVAVGAYPAPAGKRMTVTSPSAAPDYAVLYQFEVDR
jgi:hypothetical protein